jgi:hypothetical protein
MASIESEIKRQFETVYESKDWMLFKKFADFNLKEAAKLSKLDMDIESSLRLLARNSRKRLLIGVGTELLIKAIYLKCGYSINKRKEVRGFSLTQFMCIDTDRLDAANTYKFDDLITHLSQVATLADRASVERGLKIIKVFRNKEGHCVTRNHHFDPTNYQDIACALRSLYQDAFDQQLRLVFSMKRNEKPVWKLTANRQLVQKNLNIAR